MIIVPGDVRHFVGRGLGVAVERGAGAGVGCADSDYEAAGAAIVEVGRGWDSPVVFKYKAPIAAEYGHFRRDLSLGAIFHAEGDLDLVRALQSGGVTAYSYEFFRERDGSFPLASAGGEIAGKMAILYGAYHLQSHLGGAGLMLGSVPGLSPPNVLVIGHGNVGGAAARVAAALGASVTVLGRRRHALRAFAATVPGSVRCEVGTPELLDELVPASHLVVGAILESTWDTPPLVGLDLVERMPAGAVLIDATAGYGGGYLPSFDRATTPSSPTFERFGVLHCKLDALPGLVPVTAAHALSAVAAPYLARLAETIVRGGADDPSAAGRIVASGEVVHPVVERHVEMGAGGPARPSADDAA